MGEDGLPDLSWLFGGDNSAGIPTGMLDTWFPALILEI